MSTLYTENHVSYVERIYDYEAIVAVINKYLQKAKVDGCTFTCTEAKSELLGIQIRLEDIEGYEPDEDLEYDDPFRAYLENLAKELGVRRVFVPSYYFSK